MTLRLGTSDQKADAEQTNSLSNELFRQDFFDSRLDDTEHTGNVKVGENRDNL